MNVIINIPSQLNILFTVEELTAIICFILFYFFLMYICDSV